MTPTQNLTKQKVHVYLSDDEMETVKLLSNKTGIPVSRVVAGMVRQYISEETIPVRKYTLVCSVCLRSVNQLYQQNKCRACLNRDFKRLRKLMNVTLANQHLWESKGE